MSAPWSPEEIAWARECYLAGDSFAEIAEAAGRTTGELVPVLGSGASMTATQREVLSLYMSGCSFAEIDAERGGSYARPGKAAAAAIALLRRKGFAIPHRNAGFGDEPQHDAKP